MTQIAAISKAFLNGEVLSIMSAFHLFSCSNLPREVGRSIERNFGVEIHRTQVEFKSHYGHTGSYNEYQLLRTPENEAGIKKMEDYVAKSEGKQFKV